MGKFNPLKSTRAGGGETDSKLHRVWEQHKAGKPVVWLIGSFQMAPILNAMGLSWIYPDSLSAHIIGRHKHEPLLKLAEDRGYFPDTCTYTSVHMATVLLTQEQKDSEPEWRIPPPSCVIIADSSCSEYIGWGDDILHRLKAPYVTYHVPLCWENRGMDETRDYIVGGLKKVIAFLEEQTGARVDWDKLKEGMAVAKRAEEVKEECLELCRNVPSPASVFDGGATLGAYFDFWGQEPSVKLFENMKKEMEERVARKEGAVIGEKYRLAWMGLGCWFNFGRLAKKLSDAGACVVASDYFWGVSPETEIYPDDPLRTIAERLNTVGRTTEYQIDRMIKQIRDYKCDGILAHATYTCRPCSPALIQLDGVCRKEDIPYVVIESDMGDSRYWSEAQIDTRLQAFFELLDNRKKVRV